MTAASLACRVRSTLARLIAVAHTNLSSTEITSRIATACHPALTANQYTTPHQIQAARTSMHQILIRDPFGFPKVMVRSDHSRDQQYQAVLLDNAIGEAPSSLGLFTIVRHTCAERDCDQSGAQGRRRVYL